LLEIRDKSASTSEVRKQDISSWQEARITSLNSKAKKRFSKNKSAVTAYLSSDKPVEEIATEYNLSTGQLLKMAENCLKQHEDGSPWGYRALVPGVLVKDHSSSATPAPSATQDTPVQELAQKEQALDQEDEEGALEATAKRPAVTSLPADALANVLEDVAKTADTELPAQSAETPSLSTEDATSSNETVVPLPEASPASDDIDTHTPVLENKPSSNAEEPTAALEAPSDVTDATVAETDFASDTIEEPTAALEAPSDATDATDVPTSDTDLTTHELASSTPDEPTLIEIHAPDAFHAEQKQEIFQAEEPDVDNAVTAVAIIDDAHFQPLVGTTFVMPLVIEESVNTSPIDIYLLPQYVKHSTRTTTAHMAQRRRVVHKRWVRDSQDKTKRQRFYRTVSIVMVTVILLSFLLPLGVGLAAYNVYNDVSGLAHDGINHLMTVKDLLPTSKNDITSVLNAGKLQQAQTQLRDAETDFIQLQQLADRPDIQSIIQQVAPQYADKLAMAKHLLQVALDVSRMGQELAGVGVIAANIVHSSPLAASSAKPLISTADVSNIKAAIAHALYYIDDIQQNMSQVQMKDLPVSAKQQAQLSSVLTQLPSIRNLIVQNQNMVDLVAWLLGVGQARRFLVQTMDTGELRPGGGFTGQYGILNIQNGHVAPFTLRDVALLDYAGNGTELGRQAPPQYSSWMNFGNWGLRDSNLSGDYPTTAKINMQVLAEEGGGSVDGVIDLTPAFIGHIIDETGPIYVAEYNETITSANLEDKLHYYQQNYSAIAVEQLKSHDTSHQARKQFTSLLGKLLLSRVSHLPTTKLITLVKNAIKDIQSRDLEIYFTNPAAEQWLVTNGYTGGTSTFSKQDGFMVVQANISISKASEYVHTTEQDAITLDAQGGATHNLTITLDYNRAGRDVYGTSTYSDYMRVYTPQSSQLISGDGFDTGHSLCTVTPPTTQKGNQGGNSGNTTSPSTGSSCNSLPPSQTLYCSSGDYSLGARASNLPKTADVMGAPTATTSDLPGRGMFGGMTVTPSDCTSTIMLSWYVPNAVKHVGKSLVYPLLVQKQGGLIPSVQITVDASAIPGMKPFSFSGDLHADRVFTIR
jgi:hypothetical protein